MRKLGNIAAKVFDRLNDYLAIVAQVIVAYMVISITFQVITRYFFNWVPAALMETWQYGLMFIPFLGAAWLLKREGHVVMDVLIRTFKPRVQAMLNTVTSVIAAIACLVFSWFSAAMVIEVYQAGHRDTQSVLFLPAWIIIVVIPFGMALLFIQFSRRAYGFSKGVRMEVREKQLLKEHGIEVNSQGDSDNA